MTSLECHAVLELVSNVLLAQLIVKKCCIDVEEGTHLFSEITCSVSLCPHDIHALCCKENSEMLHMQSAVNEWLLCRIHLPILGQ